MTKPDLLDLVNNTKELTREKLRGWVNGLPNDKRTLNKPIANKIGDVYMHPVFQHPVILVKKTGKYWLCLSLTTEESCTVILEKCQSRFFSQSYITVTIVAVVEPLDVFMGMYDNTKHLKSVFSKIQNLINQ